VLVTLAALSRLHSRRNIRLAGHETLNTSAIKIDPRTIELSCTADALHVRLADGRELIVPLEWFPRLRAASAAQLQQHRLIGGGVGISWPDLDEDLSVEGLLAPHCWHT
jgi:hypothetical protein